MEAVIVSVGWDALLEEKGRGGAEKDRVKTCLCLKREKPFWGAGEVQKTETQMSSQPKGADDYPLRRLMGNKVWLRFNLHTQMSLYNSITHPRW